MCWKRCQSVLFEIGIERVSEDDVNVSDDAFVCKFYIGCFPYTQSGSNNDRAPVAISSLAHATRIGRPFLFIFVCLDFTECDRNLLLSLWEQ